MSGLLASFQFLTLLPIKRGFTSEQTARSTVFFPIVGLGIGLILAGLNWLLNLILPNQVVNILLIGLLALSSGGLHLDGLADTMDGAAGHRTVERRLEIMRDSRIGSFGAIGLILLFLLEYALLNSLPNDLKWLALITAPTLSRWAMVYAIFAYPYARPDGLGKAFKEGVGLQQFIPATLIALVVAGGLWGFVSLIIVLGSFLSAVLVALYLKRLLRGLTGDSYGAINEAVTVGVLLIIVLLAHNNWLVNNLWWS